MNLCAMPFDIMPIKRLVNMRRRELLLGVLLLAAPNANAADANFAKRFTKIWGELDRKYCYFIDSNIDWKKAYDFYFPLAQKCQSESEFINLIDALLRETLDAHTHIKNPKEGAPRWPPYDLYVADEFGNCIIHAVHEYSSAKENGLKAYDQILEINDIPIYNLAQNLKPKSLIKPDKKTLNYLLNLAVAGNRGKTRKIKYLKKDGSIETIILPLYKGTFPPDFDTKMLDSNIGYIAIHTFGDDAIIKQFDKALEDFKNTKGLIIDVRYNGGGDTAIARPIMGRFIKTKKPYAQMAKRKAQELGEKWIEYVDARGPFTYEKPVVVLCNHWSASMAEGFPMGMRAICGAKVLGTKMMGLGAAVYSSNAGGIDFQYSAEPVYDINGKLRDNFMPDIMLDDEIDFIQKALNNFN